MRTMMTKDDESLLLYLETCAVDYGGAVDPRKMNPSDRMTLANWTEDGLVQSGRICFDDIKGHRTLWVSLSDHAWTLAHLLRRERCERLYENRTWRKTEEK